MAFEEYPSLPKNLAYTSASIGGKFVYLFGVCEQPGEKECVNELYVLDLTNVDGGWQQAPSLPGRERFLAQAASFGDKIYILGGLGLIEEAGAFKRELIKETWSYSPAEGWKQLADMPYPVAAAPTCAPVSNSGNIYILGGDEGSGKNYTPATNPGFKNQSLCFDTQAGTWADAGEIGAPRAVLPTCELNGIYYLFNGELKPGLRSNKVWQVLVK